MGISMEVDIGKTGGKWGRCVVELCIRWKFLILFEELSFSDFSLSCALIFTDGVFTEFECFEDF